MNEHIKYYLNVNKNIWHVSFRLTQENGEKKLKCLSTGIRAGSNGKSNKRLAEEKAYEIISKYESLILSDKAELSLGDYIVDWLKRNIDIQPSTRDGYVHMINRHIKPYFEQIALREVKPYHLQQYIVDKVSEGLSPNTVCKHITLIKTALKDAVINELIKSNPAEKVKKPRRVRPKHDFYTSEQLKALLRIVSGTDLELPVMFAVLFGLRRSEVLAVKWSNIDFRNATLSVCEKITRQKDAEGNVVDTLSDELKTESSRAVYYLNPVVCDYLLKKQKEQAIMPRVTHEYCDFVCVNQVGELLKLDYITHKFTKILKENNLPHIRFHDLRHSCITLLANDNRFTMKQVQDYARHANFNLTADTYSHVIANSKLTELNAICADLGFGEDNQL